MIVNKMKSIIKFIMLFAIILFTYIFLFWKVIDSGVLAASSAQQTTDDSKSVPVEDAKDWTVKVDEDGKVVLHSSYADTLDKLVPAEQVMDDGTIYITLDDLHNIPSLFCSAKGVALPGYNSTVVRSGGMETDVTDQGKKTAFLTVEDLNAATVFRSKTDWTDYSSSGPSNIFEETTSRTYGRFSLVETRKATPAEAWVLVEMDKNLPRSTSDLSYEPTDREFTGTEAEITNQLEINGTTIYVIGETGEEEYLEKRGEKYYYVDIVNPSGGGDATYSYVQYAWWKVKTVGTNVAAIKDLDGGLAAEAEAFEDYIIAVTGNSDVHNLERNEDDTFKIDYKVSMTPNNSEDVTVSFDSESNKYLVGPFTVSYLRACTQQGERAKVSFAGIKSTILVGIDAEGNEVLDSEGNSILQRGQNYKFVYSDENAHKAKQEGFGDTDEDYPFPYDGEEFYIEMDYIDDVVALKNLKFDFQYMTANGSYELYEGEYLTIHWEPMADVRSRVVSSGGVALLEENDRMVGLSNRASNSANSITIPFTETTKEPDESKLDVNFSASGGTASVTQGITEYIDAVNLNAIQIGGFIGKQDEWIAKYKDFEVTSITCDNSDFMPYGNSGGTNSYSVGSIFYMRFKRDYSSAHIKKTYIVTVNYSYLQSDHQIMPQGWSSWYRKTDSTTLTITVEYDNKLLEDVKLIAPEAVNLIQDGAKIYVEGITTDNNRKIVDFDVEFIDKARNYSNPPDQNDVIWDIVSGSNVVLPVDLDTGEFKIIGSGKATLICQTLKNGQIGEVIESKKFIIEVPPFCIIENEYRDNKDITAGNDWQEFQIYNGFADLSDLTISGDLPDAIHAQLKDGKIQIIRSETRCESGKVNVVCTDKCGNSVTLNVSYDGNIIGGNVSLGGGGSGYEYSYRYYMVADEASSGTAQTQINASGTHERINIDAENGLGTTVSGVPVELEFIHTPINLRTSLSGMVWIDHDEQKDDATSGKLGVYDEGDKTADKLADDNSVEVVVWKVKYEVSTGKEVEREKAIAWDEQGKVIDFTQNRIYIKDGKYTIPEIQVPAEEGLDGTKYVISYDVEFIYDGQTYEATEYLVPSTGEDKDTVSDKLAAFKKTADETKGPEKDYVAYANSSYIVENADERYDFDKYFTEVYGDIPISTDGTTYGKATGGKGGSQYNYVELGEEEVKEAGLQYNSSDVTSETTEDVTKIKSQLVTKDADGYILPQYRFAARTSESGLLLPYERLYHVEKEYYDNLTFQANQYKPIDEYFHQINLGLLEREEADVSVIKDLYTANVVVNEHLSTYHYNKLGQLTDEALTLQETLGYRKQKYTIDLYNSDYYYRSSAYLSIEDTITKQLVTAMKEGTELQLFLTYRIQFTNESDNMNASINEFKDYYDSSFTLVTNEMCQNAEDKKEYSEVANDDGQFQKYITSIKPAGSTENEEISREAKTVAYSPYYRKLTYLSDPTATSTATTETPDPAKTDYYWNRDEDIDSAKVNKVETSAKNLTVTQGADENGYHTFTYSGLKPENSIKEGKLPNSDPLVLEPNETIEFYVSFQVDLEGYIAATEQTPSDAQSDDIRADKLTGEKRNIVEITNYSSGYNYISNEQKARHTTVSYSNDNISGRIDQDSAPDNMNIEKVNEFKYTEDDNEFAPAVQVSVEAIQDSRKLDGTVWEDSRADNDVGNGVLDDGEKGIGGIDVTMVEKIRVTKQDLLQKGYSEQEIANLINQENINDFVIDNEFEYVWKTETKADGTVIQQIPGFDAQIISSNEEGKEGYYSFTNFPTGTFVIRFEYGNDVNDTDLKYNGQDYKNTTYQKGMTNPTESADNVPTNSSDMTYLAGKSTLNNEWHDLSSNENAKALEEARVSDARDYEPQRMRVIAYSRTITNENAETLASANLAGVTTKEDESNGYTVDKHLTTEYKELLESRKQEFVDNTRMVANTAKLYVDVENQNSIAYKTIATTEGNSNNSETGATTDHEYYIKNIDFGLVERAETRINIQKEISKIQLLKNDGQEVILSVECDEDGNIIKTGGTSEDTVRVEKITEINKESLSGQGFKYIAMESSFLKGLQVKLTYKITLENNSECDYLGSTLSNIKNAQVIYNLANNYENRDTERLYSNGIDSNTVPFISGKGIIYGKYLGSYYYTGEYEEKDVINNKYSAKLSDEASYDRYDGLSIVTTTIDQLVDYIDNDLSISIDDTSNYENQVWVNSSDSDRENKLSAIAYEPNEAGNYLKTETQLQDDKGRAYVVKNGDTTTSNNISFSANTLMEDKPITVSYGKIALAGESDTQAATRVVSDEPVGKLDTTRAELSGENVVQTDGTDKKLKFLTYETQQVDLGYIYTLKTGNSGNTNDVYNTRLTSQLVPKTYTPKAGEEGTMYTTSIKIVTTAQANEQAINNMNYDNLVEVAMYSNTAGRRDMQAIPGNANMIAKDYKAYEAGYKKNYTDDTWYANEIEYTSGTGVDSQMYKVYTERDAYAARDTVTFSEPTGLSLTRQRINIIVQIILIGLIIAAFATIGVTVTIVLKKTKYDDIDILKS